jgi:hypothetical protein
MQHSETSKSLTSHSEPPLAELARALSHTELVPDAFKKKPGNIFAALQLASELGIGPMTLMRGVYFVKGRPSFDSQLAVALLRRSERTIGPMRFEEDAQEGGRCRAVVRDKELAEDVRGPWVSMDMARADGWTANAKYKSMPGNMLRKRAAIFLIREAYPEVLGGYHTREEIEDVVASEPREVEIEPSDLTDLNRAAGLIDDDPEPEERAHEAAPILGDDGEPSTSTSIARTRASGSSALENARSIRVGAIGA